MAARYTLRVDQGATTKRTIYWTNALASADGTPALDAAGNMQQGEPINLAGYTGRMKVRKAVTESAELLSLTVGNGGIVIPTQPTSLHTQCVAATTVNITLSGTQTVDGIALVAGDRALVRNQAVPADNGIYVVAAGAWTRSVDANTAAEVTIGNSVWVYSGTVNAHDTFSQTSAVTNLGVDPQTWDVDVNVGQVQIIMTDEQTATLATSGVYDLEVESAGGEVTRILQGKLRLSAEVTHD